MDFVDHLKKPHCSETDRDEATEEILNDGFGYSEENGKEEQRLRKFYKPK